MTWRTYSCEISGKIAIVLLDRQFENCFPLRELPLLSWFGVYCNLPPKGACWAEAETVALDRVEDELIELTAQFGRGCAVYVFRIATPGIREYYVYHSAEAQLREAYEALTIAMPNYKIEFESIEDASWEQYRRYVGFKEKSRSMLSNKSAVILTSCFVVPFIAGFWLCLLSILKFNINAITLPTFFHLSIISTVIGGICGICGLFISLGVLFVRTGNSKQ